MPFPVIVNLFFYMNGDKAGPSHHCSRAFGPDQFPLPILPRVGDKARFAGHVTTVTQRIILDDKIVLDCDYDVSTQGVDHDADRAQFEAIVTQAKDVYDFG